MPDMNASSRVPAGETSATNTEAAAPRELGQMASESHLDDEHELGRDVLERLAHGEAKAMATLKLEHHRTLQAVARARCPCALAQPLLVGLVPRDVLGLDLACAARWMVSAALSRAPRRMGSLSPQR